MGMEAMKYRPEVDGLRTVAVVPVVWFHLFPLLPGGFLGVDVFFVISGFLITTILLRELSAGTFSLWSFWNRRLRRITPVLFVVTSVTLLASMLVVFPPNLPTVAFDALSAIGSFANYNVWLNYGDYWGSAAETSFFLHAWSLSVEEQFYLIYPSCFGSFIVTHLDSVGARLAHRGQPWRLLLVERIPSVGSVLHVAGPRVGTGCRRIARMVQAA